MEKQLVEQLERVVEAEVPRPGAAYRGALQLPGVGAGHGEGARLIWHGRRRVSLRIREAEQASSWRERDGVSWAEPRVLCRGVVGSARAGRCWNVGWRRRRALKAGGRRVGAGRRRARRPSLSWKPGN